MKTYSRCYMPLILLMSVPLICMDQEYLVKEMKDVVKQVAQGPVDHADVAVPQAIREENSETTLVLEQRKTEAPATIVATEPVVLIAAVKSTIGLPEVSVEKKEQVAQVSPQAILEMPSVKSSRGLLTHLSYGWYGNEAMVEHELKQGTFNANIFENRQNLYTALTKLSSNPEKNRLPELYAILNACTKQNLSVDELAVLKQVYAYVDHILISKQGSLKSTVEKSATNSKKFLEENQTLVQKTISDIKQKLENHKIEHDKSIEKSFGDHMPDIIKANEVKALISKVNPALLAVWAADTNKPSDQAFVEKQLGLDVVMSQATKMTERMVANLQTMTDLAKDIKDTRLKKPVESQNETV